MAELERRRQAERQRTIDDASAPIGIVCGVLGLCLGLGILTGPAAIYFGYRARRANHRTASTWCFVLGAADLMCFTCWLPQILAMFAGSGTGY